MKINPNFQTIALWLCSLGLAYYIGTKSDSGAKEREASASNGVQGEDRGDKGILKPPQGASGTEVPAEAEYVSYLQDPLTASDHGISLLSAMQAGDPVLRIRAFTEALQNLDDSTLPGILEAFDTLPKGTQRYTELRMLMHAWAEKSPEDALTFAMGMSRQERQFAISTALSSWAMLNPDAALDWAEMDSGGRDKNPYMPAIISGTAEHDMVKATDLLFEMSYGYTRGSALRHLIGKNIQMGGIRQLMGWVDQLPQDRDPKLVEGISTMVASQLVDYDLEAAGVWVKNLKPEQGRARALSTVVRELANDSTESAKDWLEGLPEEDQYATMPELIRKWAMEDAGSAGEWLNQYPPSVDLDKAVTTYVRSIRREDPEAAKDWAFSIVNEETRKKVIDSIDNPQSEIRFDINVDGDGRSRIFRTKVE